MKRIAIITCARYGGCGGGKCFRAVRERRGGFAAYPPGETVEVVGFSTCGGCPGGNVESVPAEFKRNGAEVVHLATGLVVGYPPCPSVERFKTFIETAFGLPVVIGTHPIPLKYLEMHRRLPFWDEMRTCDIAGSLMREPRDVMQAYD